MGKPPPPRDSWANLPLLTRRELRRIPDVSDIRRDPDSIRQATNFLLEAGLAAEPRGKGQGLEITDQGRQRLSRRAKKAA